MKRLILRNGLMQLWDLVSTKSEGQAGRLEIQVRVDIRFSGLNPQGRLAGWKLGQDFNSSGEVEFHLLQEPSVLLLRPSVYWMRSATGWRIICFT